MSTEDALLAARRHIDDALDSLDRVGDDHSVLTVIAAFFLTAARIVVNLRLDELESEGVETDDPRA